MVGFITTDGVVNDGRGVIVLAGARSACFFAVLGRTSCGWASLSVDSVGRSTCWVKKLS